MNIRNFAKTALCAAGIASWCGAGTTARADYASNVLALNPIVYYHLNDTNPVAGDTFSNSGSAGAAGLAFGLDAPTHQVPGAIAAETNTALGLDATLSQYVSIPGSAAVNPSENNARAPFSVEVWLNPSGAATGPNTMIPLGFSQINNFAGGNPRTGWQLMQEPTGWTMRAWQNSDSTVYVDTVAGAAPDIGVYTHVVVQYDGTNVLLYTNGVLAASQAVVPFYGVIHCPVAWVLGGRSDYNRFWSGSMDELAVYTNVLSASDILAHYQNGTNASSTPGSYEALVQADQPILYYRLDDPAPVTGGTLPTAANLGSFGSANDTSYEPGTTPGVAGPIAAGIGTNNLAVKFNGCSDSATTMDNMPIPPLSGVFTTDFSFCCWFHNPSVQETAGFGGLLIQRAANAPAGNGGIAGIDFYQDGVQNMAMWNDSDYADLPSPGCFPPLNVWSFIAMVWTATNGTMYLNGVPHVFIPQINPRLPHEWGTDPLYLGYDSAYNYVAVNGAMCEAAIFSNALSSNDVQTLFQASQIAPQVVSVTQAPTNPIFAGSSVTLSASAFGAGTLSYQWRQGGAPLPNKTNTTLAFNNAVTTNSGSYDVVVTSAFGSVTSAVEVLAVINGPVYVIQDLPPALSRYAGLNFTLRPVIGGSSPTFQWFKNGGPITGATSATLDFPSLSAGDAGSYVLDATNSFGHTNTSTTVLTVIPVAASATYAQTVIAATPYAYWRFDETSGTNAYDYAGGFDGVYSGNVINDQAGAPLRLLPAWKRPTRPTPLTAA